MLEKRQLQPMERLVLWNLSLHEPLLFCVCRAIIIRNNDIIPVSTEFTPESERQRLQFLVRKLLSEPEYGQIFAVRSAVYIELHAQHTQLEAGDPRLMNSACLVDRRNNCSPQFLTLCSHKQQDISSPSVSDRAVQQLSKLFSW